MFWILFSKDFLVKLSSYKSLSLKGFLGVIVFVLLSIELNLSLILDILSIFELCEFDWVFEILLDVTGFTLSIPTSFLFVSNFPLEILRYARADCLFSSSISCFVGFLGSW